ncbi:MAG: FtsW/RodA/SpoVE family cell cycle protein [Solobacterium sp.]|nr:FtsW/RodA/SpoVE family cell cycle protein [Solobacterium sp.]
MSEIQTTEKQSRDSFRLILVIILQMILGLTMFLKLGSDSIRFFIVLIPLIVITALLGAFCHSRGVDMKLYCAFAVLTSAGTALQMLIDKVYHPLTTFSELKTAVAFAVAIFFILFYKLFRKILDKAPAPYLMIVLSAAVYAVLYLFGYDPNGYGTYAWLKIGSYTLQLTDATKVIAVMFYSSLFASRKERNDQYILVLSNIFFLTNLAGAVLIHELGSFFILYIVHMGMIIIFMRHSDIKRRYVIAVIALTVLALGTSFLLFYLLRPMAEAGTMPSLFRVIWPIVKKVHTRFSITANLTEDPYGAGYQLLQGKKALWMGGLFGNTVNFTAIPVPESDMAYISLINSFGFVWGFLVMAAFLRIMRAGSRISIRLLETDRRDAAVAYGVTLMLFLQAMFVIFGSCNIIPLAGLPIPFLSRGGTYQMITFCFAGLLLYMSRRPQTEGGEDLREPEEYAAEDIPEQTKIYRIPEADEPV